MEIELEYGGTAFVWHDAKALENERKHGIEFFCSFPQMRVPTSKRATRRSASAPVGVCWR